MTTQWRKICSNLQKRLTPGSYKVWIKPLHASISAQGLELVAPSAFVAEWIRDRLLSDITASVTETCGKTLPVLVRAENASSANRVRLAPPAGSAQAAAPKLSDARIDQNPTDQEARGDQDGQDARRIARLRSKAGPDRLRERSKDGIGSSAAFADAPAPVEKRGAPAPGAPATAAASAGASNGARRDFAPGRPFPAPSFSSREQLTLPVTATLAAPQIQPVAWRYAFESFVVGPTNNMAYAAARNMARAGTAVDMLFLSSGPGLGKTHLTQAVGHALCQSSNRAHPRVEYLTAEEFSSCFVQALRAREMERFKGRFRDVDLLLLEDVHFLQGKEKMQDEVLSTIKTLQSRGSRVVLTSSFAPCELRNVDAQLVSRFCSGFLAGIEKPDAETRRRILMEKAREHETTLPGPVLDLLTDRLTGDIRQLESCVHTLVLKGRLLGHTLSTDMAGEILAQYAQENPLLGIDAIIRKVCEGFGLSPEQLRSRSRKQNHVVARNTIFYLARRHTALSLQEIGDRFNRRHSTVLKGISAVERELRRESSLGRQIASTLSLVERSGA